MAGKSRFTPEQEAHIVSLAGDRKALRAAYPGVPTSTLRSVLARHDAPPVNHPWEPDNAVLRECYPDYQCAHRLLPHRTIYALRRQAMMLGLCTGIRRNGGGRVSDWTPEQVELVRQWGMAGKIPGKTRYAAISFRHRHAIKTTARPLAAPTAHEVAMVRLRRGPKPVVPGADLLRQVRGLVWRIERHRADDITGEALLLLLSGEAETPAQAVRTAAARVRRLHPTHARDLSWDQPLFPGARLTLADVVAADAWRVAA